MLDLLQLRSGLRVADLGCGRGDLSRQLAVAVAPGGRVVGFDLDEEQLEAARGAGGAGLRFEVGDALDLHDVPDRSFDRAVCRRLLIHQSRPADVVREMCRIVRPGGLVAAIEPDELYARAAAWDPAGAFDPALLRLRAEIQRLVLAGVSAAGAGDRRLGPRLPGLMTAAGLADVASTVALAGDPDDALRWIEQGPKTPTERDLFLAAGGAEPLWRRWVQREETIAPERRRRLQDGRWSLPPPEELHVCAGRVQL